MERLSVLYASALFDLAMERGALDEFQKQVDLLLDSLKDAECQRVIVHPHISATEKKAFFTNAFAGHVHETLLGFLFLVADKNRESFLVPALVALKGMIDRFYRKVTANVSFAAQLDEEQVAEMKAVLSKHLDKTVEIDLKIDPAVVGGPYIFVDGYYLDWTVRKRLRDLTVHMKEGCSA